MAKRGLAVSAVIVLIAATASAADQPHRRRAWDWSRPEAWAHAPFTLTQGLGGSLRGSGGFEIMGTGSSPNKPLLADGDMAFSYKIIRIERTGQIRVDGHRYTANGTFVVLTVRAENDRSVPASPAGWDRRHWGHFALFDTTVGRYFTYPWLQASDRGHGVGPHQSVVYQVPFDIPDTAVPAHATIRATSGDEYAWLQVPRT